MNLQEHRWVRADSVKGWRERGYGKARIGRRLGRRRLLGGQGSGQGMERAESRI